jgi:hypothetical protein
VSEKKYRLISEGLPVAERAVRISEYDGLLDDFVKGKAGTVRVDYPSKSTKALMAALRARVKKKDLKVKVAMRKRNLYLTKA